MNNQEKYRELIKILKDTTLSVSERDDAAMDLYIYTDEEVEKALITQAKSRGEDETIINSCGESLGMIWLSKGRFDLSTYLSLTGTARAGIFKTIRHFNYKMIEDLNLPQYGFED